MSCTFGDCVGFLTDGGDSVKKTYWHAPLQLHVYRRNVCYYPSWFAAVKTAEIRDNYLPSDAQ